MSRDPMELVFEGFERLEEPRAAFADALLAQLLAELVPTQLPARPRRRWSIPAFAAAAVVVAIVVAVVSIIPRGEAAYANVEKAVLDAATLPPLSATFRYQSNEGNRGVYKVRSEERRVGKECRL